MKRYLYAAMSLLLTSLLLLPTQTQAQKEQWTPEAQAFVKKMQAKDDARIRERDFFAALYNIAIDSIDENENPMQLFSFTNGRPNYAHMLNFYSAQTTRTDRVKPGGAGGLNLTGVGIDVGIWEPASVYDNHPELRPRVSLQRFNGYAAHPTHVAGTIGAAGIDYLAEGMAPACTMTSWGMIYFSDMAQAATNGLRLSNHSYGLSVLGWQGGSWWGNTNISTQEDHRFGFYTYDAYDFDDIVNNFPYFVVVQAAGNDRGQSDPINNPPLFPPDGGASGYECMPPQACAKNIITVGNVDGPPNFPMAYNSNWGPTDDGRIKPDIVADGEDVYSTTYPAGYATMSGTSMAAPNVTGSIALLMEHQRDLHGPDELLASTYKALIIHTAEDLGNPGPDYSYGWGLLNTEKAAAVISKNNGFPYHIYDNVEIVDGAIHEYLVYSAGSEPLRATLCWTDPPANPLALNLLDDATPRLIDNLDLRIENESQTDVYYPYTLQGAANPSANATQNQLNSVDNVEQVDLPTVAPGFYRIIVDESGPFLNGNQHYSLIITGNDEPLLCYGDQALHANSQRKIDYSPMKDAYDMVYECEDIVWYTESSDGGATWAGPLPLSRQGITGSNPCIASSNITVAAFLEPGPQVRIGEIRKGQMANIQPPVLSAIQQQTPYYYEFVSYSTYNPYTAASDAHPVVVIPGCAGMFGDRVILVYETNRPNRELCYVRYNGGTVYDYGLIPNTDYAEFPSLSYPGVDQCVDHEIQLAWKVGDECRHKKIFDLTPITFSATRTVNDPQANPILGPPSITTCDGIYMLGNQVTALVAFRTTDDNNSRIFARLIDDQLYLQPYLFEVPGQGADDVLENPSVSAIQNTSFEYRIAFTQTYLNAGSGWLHDTYVGRISRLNLVQPNLQVSNAIQPQTFYYPTPSMGRNAYFSTQTRMWAEGREWKEILVTDQLLNKISSSESEPIPQAITLENAPNPFSASTVITFSIPDDGLASLDVYDMLGRKVSTLVNSRLDAGRYSIAFAPSALPFGVYYCRLQAGANLISKTLVYQK